MIDLAALRAVKACDKHFGTALAPRPRPCNSCLRLVVAAVLEEAVRIGEGMRVVGDTWVSGIASIREAAKEVRGP